MKKKQEVKIVFEDYESITLYTEDFFCFNIIKAAESIRIYNTRPDVIFHTYKVDQIYFALNPSANRFVNYSDKLLFDRIKEFNDILYFEIEGKEYYVPWADLEDDVNSYQESRQVDDILCVKISPAPFEKYFYLPKLNEE
mgnify:CR=1 FL=1